MNRKFSLLIPVVAVLTTVFFLQTVEARRPQIQGGARTSVNHAADRGQAAHRNINTNQRVNNANVNRNRTNINQNVNVNNVNRNVNINVDNDYHGGGWYDDNYHPIATAAAVTATAVVTAAVIGSIVHSIPPSCSAVIVNGITYQQCGSSWYQPQYQGTQVQYIVVNPPN